MIVVCYILRDDLPVAKLTNQSRYDDYLSYGTHRYRVRMIDENDNFVDSNEVTLTTEIRHTTVAGIDAPADLAELVVRVGETPTRGKALALQSQQSQIDGREFPVYTFLEFSAASWEFTFSAEMEQYARFERIIDIRRPIVVRNRYCGELVGVVTGISPEYLPYHVNFTLVVEQCDFVREVPYD